MALPLLPRASVHSFRVAIAGAGLAGYRRPTNLPVPVPVTLLDARPVRRRPRENDSRICRLQRRTGRVVFAGEHTSERWQGYMNGAVESGQHAARELLTVT